METSTGLSIFLRPLIAFAIILLIVKPVKYLLWKIIPEGRIKERLFRKIN